MLYLYTQRSGVFVKKHRFFAFKRIYLNDKFLPLDHRLIFLYKRLNNLQSVFQIGHCPGGISLFNRDPGVVQIGNCYLRTVSVFYLIFAAMQILNGLLLGYGKALVPMIASIGSLCLLQVPTAILLSGTELAYRGIWIAAPVGWLGGLLIRFLYFRHIARKQAALKEA